MLLASMFVTASVFQFTFSLLDVLITLLTCTLFLIILALPTPASVKSSAFVTRSFILLNASLRSSCSVNELVVTDPIKNLAPLSISDPSISGRTLVVLPSLSVSIRIASPNSTYTNNQIVVNIPNVRKPMPLFIVMRALGVISDKDIMTTCLLDIEENSDMLELLLENLDQVYVSLTDQL